MGVITLYKYIDAWTWCIALSNYWLNKWETSSCSTMVTFLDLTIVVTTMLTLETCLFENPWTSISTSLPPLLIILGSWGSHCQFDTLHLTVYIQPGLCHVDVIAMSNLVYSQFMPDIHYWTVKQFQILITSVWVWPKWVCTLLDESGNKLILSPYKMSGSGMSVVKALPITLGIPNMIGTGST